MAFITFETTRFKPDAIRMIEICNDVILGHHQQGLLLSLRQLYYQLVIRNILPNTERSYKNLGNLVTKARLSGRMDWDAIEDRVRRPRRAAEWSGLKSLTESALDSYRLPRWKGQDYYAELWVEKDALAGVLEPLSREFHSTLMVNRGYSSASAMYESARRFIDRCLLEGDDEDVVGQAYPDGPEGQAYDLARTPVLFYLGDHDPSGEDMVRDVRDRLKLFGVDVDVRKIGLTMDQVRQYKLPPNPAKMSDSRAAAYVEKHGHRSWEVDALPARVLVELVRKSFRSVLDQGKMAAIMAQEELDKTRLRKAVSKIG